MKAFVPWLSAAILAHAIVVPDAALALFNNGDFELGNFFGWTKANYETLGLLGPCNGPFSGINTLPGGSDQSEIVGPSPPETLVDPVLGAAATLRFPKFGNYSARVNGQAIHRILNSITQQSDVTDVDPLDEQVHVRFVYAPVLQAPNHHPCDQPFFHLLVNKILPSGGTTPLYEKYVFANEAGVPWKTVSSLAGDTQYTDWTVVDVTSPALGVGDTVALEVTGADCAQEIHFGYVYVDAFGAQLPGLSVVKTASTPWLYAGDNLTYTFTYRNAGPTPITNVIITETIPDCATWVSNSDLSTGGTCLFASPTVTCTAGTLAPGDSGTFTVTVMASTDTACSAINNGNYAIEGTNFSPLLGPPVTTPIVGRCIPPPISMAGWWPLDEASGITAHDMVAGHGGTHQGTLPIPRIAGPVGQSLQLDGAGEFVLIPDPADGALDFGPPSGTGSKDFSIDAWIRPAASPGYRAIFWKGTKRGYGFGLRDNRLSLVMKSSAGLREILSNPIPSLSDGQWHLVAVTVDRDGGEFGGALVFFYFDGSLVHFESLDPLPGTLNNTQAAAIGLAHMEGGNFGDFASQSFGGGIDEVEVFPYVLRPKPIHDVWLAATGGKCKSYCSVPAVTGLCGTDTSVVVPVEIHNSSPTTQTYTPSGSTTGLPAGFQFGGQTSTVEGPPIFSASSFNPSGPSPVPAESVAPVLLTLQRPSGFIAQGERAAYRVTVSGPDGDRACVGFLVDARYDCGTSVGDGHGAARVGVPVRKLFEIRNDSGATKSYDLQWRVQDSEGASDTSVVSLGSLPPGEPLTRSSVVAAPGETITEELLVTPIAPEGMRTFDIVLSADLDGDGELEPATSAGLRTTLPAADLVPGRVVTVASGKVAFVAKPMTDETLALPDAIDDPTIAGGSLEVLDTGGSGSSTYALPASGWKGLGNPAGATGYKFKGAGSLADPCKVVLIKRKGLKALCKGPAVALTTPFTGDVGAVLSIGSHPRQYCATFGGTTVRNDSLLLKRKEAPAADRCAAANP